MSFLDGLRLVAITDLDRTAPAPLIERWKLLASSARPDAVAIDLRAKGHSARELLELGAELKRIARTHGQRLLVNERLDIARLLDADAIHLREDSVEAADARSYFRALGSATIVFRACHSLSDAPRLDADAIFLSPILEARKGNPALGLEALTRANLALRAAGKATRVFALGGVDARGAAQCLAAGAHGVAAIAAALGNDSPLPLLDALGARR